MNAEYGLNTTISQIRAGTVADQRAWESSARVGGGPLTGFGIRVGMSSARRMAADHRQASADGP